LLGGRFYCSVASRENAETLYGTVARIRSWLLIEYPSVWRRNAINDSLLLSERFKRYIDGLEATGKIERTLLIRQEHFLSGAIRCFFVNSCEPVPYISNCEIGDYDELVSSPHGGQRVDGLMYAVCTHGRHDKCCAKFGLPVYCAIRDRVGATAWQCSHVGGDRFAGNVVVFPYGLYYGRVTPDVVGELIETSERGEVWLKGYRGRSCFRRPEQVAEYFARRESGRLAIDEFHPIDLRSGGGRTRVRFQARSDGSIHLVEFATKASALNELLTCHSDEPSPVTQYELVSYRRVPAT
jgi:hypothetical protein